MVLSEVTLVCIDCRNHLSALRALERSMWNIKFGRVLFLSDIPSTLPGIKAQYITPIKSKEEYSYFMLNELNDFIDTRFCLVIQYDGYVINADLWNNDFLNYDYIGAPWWYDDGKNVGNGGFSLRSKKLLEACQKENFDNNTIEDNAICRENRELLEKKYKIRFAPESVAERFSFEPNRLRPHFRNDTFGFHGVPKLIL